MRARALACVLTAGAIAAGCGGQRPPGGAAHPPGGLPHPAARAPTALLLPQTGTSLGRAVFAHDCAACHSLIGNESLRKQGGDLSGYRMTTAQIRLWTVGMPTRPLTPAQLAAVVGYVHAAQRG